ncbi:MAG: 23S rRNA (adenine(2030)-N(6))-methyltransferase RlmJ [Alphaproteobacteria bacterium]|nr:23S rRNA (adenine(2030)-N(6))-methyltransferase RlmJ [Alphaproteobacteria bacterium]MBF0250132.1 23S rRNA (adenine(2030)-N(6))-methyltransferase RlmJ [Alphaproteobacteria bacterium]
MLSYLHAFHAGGPADVHKHAALAALIAHMTAKDKPLTYMETHAGSALYDLAAPEAVKTGEAVQGILRLEAGRRLPAGHPYAQALAAVRAKHGKTAYPGSPLLARALLRPGDVMHLMELHPREFEALRARMRGPKTHVHRRDGFEGVLALSPPTPRRGLVLVDPSFEVKSEYDDAAAFVVELHQKWPEAVIALWYPLLPAGLHQGMCEAIEAAGLPRLSRREAVFNDPAATRGMHGDGVLVVNTPYGVADALKAAQRLCSSLLG